MALDDAFRDQIDIAIANRAQLPPVPPPAPKREWTEAPTFPEPGDWQHWYEFGAVWLLLLAVGIAVAVATRGQAHTGLRWLRRGLLVWAGVCAVGAIASVRRSDPDYATWIAISAWPPILLLALLAGFSYWRRRTA